MRIKNLTNRGLKIVERSLSPGQKMTVADERLPEVQHLLDEGLVSIEKVKITEKKIIKEGEHG